VRNCKRKLSTAENRKVRKILAPRRGSNGKEGKMNNEKLNYLYSTPNIIKVLKSKKLKWAALAHVLNVGEKRNYCWNLVWNSERSRMEDIAKMG
jgi:hypothetical protein